MDRVRRIYLKDPYDIITRLTYDDNVVWILTGQTKGGKTIEFVITTGFTTLECVAERAHQMLGEYRERHDRHAAWVESALKGANE